MITSNKITDDMIILFLFLTIQVTVHALQALSTLLAGEASMPRIIPGCESSMAELAPALVAALSSKIAAVREGGDAVLTQLADLLVRIVSFQDHMLAYYHEAENLTVQPGPFAMFAGKATTSAPAAIKEQMLPRLAAIVPVLFQSAPKLVRPFYVRCN